MLELIYVYQYDELATLHFKGGLGGTSLIANCSEHFDKVIPYPKQVSVIKILDAFYATILRNLYMYSWYMKQTYLITIKYIIISKNEQKEGVEKPVAL